MFLYNAAAVLCSVSVFALISAVDVSSGGYQQLTVSTLDHDGERGSLLRRESAGSQSDSHGEGTVVDHRAEIESKPEHTVAVISGEEPIISSMFNVPTQNYVTLVSSWLQYWRPVDNLPTGQHPTAALQGATGATPNDAKLTVQQPAALDGDPEKRRYLSFETDGGGFNNIRMAFEYFVSLAARSGRTLVLPAPEGWYLIDWGSRNAHGKNLNDQEWIPSGTNSTYQEFWDIESLRARGMSVLSADKFYDLERERLGMEKQPPTSVVVNQPDESPWKHWLRQHAGRLATTCQEGVDKSLATSPQLVHLPYRSDDTSHPAEYRFLDCEPRDEGKELLHYNPHLFDLAAIPIAKLGIGRFAALHLRRNDFQYTQAPGADGVQSLLAHLDKYLAPKEAVYVASDEVDAAWWNKFRNALAKNGHDLFTLHSFDSLFATHAAPLSDRHAGIVEQLICAGARIFVGTPLSTYTAGIQDMRQSLALARGTTQAAGTRAAASEAEVGKAGAVAYHAERLLAKI